MSQTVDPRVMAWQAANSLLGAANQIEDQETYEYGNLISLAQVYASLASVPGEVLIGLQLSALESAVQSQQAQQAAEEIVEPSDDEPNNVVPIR